MANKQVKTQFLVENQLPLFVQDEYPLFTKFLKQYYISQEYQSGILDIVRNLTSYIKPDSNYKEIKVADTVLTSDVSFSGLSISVESTKSWPSSYGLLKIDNEIITYTSKDDTTFYGCIRGFSGITEYGENLTFEETSAEEHTSLTSDGEFRTVKNLSVLFLQKFFEKIKNQYLFGFENKTLTTGLDQSLFLKSSKDFYTSKGTDKSFEILFKVLFGKDIDIIKPQDNLIKPSSADFNYTKDIVVNVVSGNIFDLEGKTIFQDEDKDYSKIKKCFGTVKNIEGLYLNNKFLYKLRIDYGYDKDVPVTGSIFGNFQAIGATKVVDFTSDTINVDSTVGFPNSGSFIIDDSINVSYKDKNSTQFLNCTISSTNFRSGSEIQYNHNSYGYTKSGEKVEFKILSVISDLENQENLYGLHENESIYTSTPGTVEYKNNPKFNTWLYNVSPTSNVFQIEIEDLSDNLFKISTFDAHLLTVDDKITLLSEDGIVITNIVVVSILSEKSFICKILSSVDLAKKYKFKRNITKSSFDFYQNSLKYYANVQNVYSLNDDAYIFSNSLPSKINTNGGLVEIPVNKFSTFINSTNDVIELYTSSDNRDHGFYTGDIVDYIPSTYVKSRYLNSGTLLQPETRNFSPGREVNAISGISSGKYFVKRIDDKKIKLASSLPNLYAGNFIDIGPVGIASTYVRTNFSTYYEVISDVTPQSFYKKDVKSNYIEGKKIVRRVRGSDNKELGQKTNNKIGILINGVEVKSYKSDDSIYYGPIQSINVISGGNGYDIINPPYVKVEDAVGYGFTGSPVISGSLKEIEVEYGGFNYTETPKIDIRGGNGSGAKAEAKISLVDNIAKFDPISGINTSTNTIQFLSPHNFIDCEKIIYKNFYGTAIGIGSTSLDAYRFDGLSNDSTYFAKVVNPTSIKICNTLADCLSNNPINITDFGSGTQHFQSVNKKNTIKSIQVTSPGSGYEYKKRLISSSGINTSLNSFTFVDHDYKSGEILTYQTTGTVISGLSTSQSYYVTVIDKDNFKLSEIGNTSDIEDFYYRNKIYVNITSSGSGNHIFNYPPITVTAVGNVGITTNTTTVSYDAILKPKFLGSIKSVSVENGGVGYGSSEIINFERSPIVEISSGQGAYLKPIVLNGSIVDVAILNPGSGYTSTPKLTVYGSGKYAVLSPKISAGKITSVTVVNGGINYGNDSTSIFVDVTGKNAKIKANIKEWKINLFEKNKDIIQDDDGYISLNPHTNKLEFSYLYAPRYLRSIISQINSDGSKAYSSIDLDADTSANPPLHSPIIGWAYDGNPIYGPYGFSTKTGGSPRLMRSGYELIPSSNRPPFRNGFFVDDYVFTDKGDLDEHNGRFCVTPEYPNGVYAYFATIDPDAISESGLFKGCRIPVFPYFIGNTFKNKRDKFNTDDITQDEFDVNDNNLLRITHPYKVDLKNSDYEFIFNKNNKKLKSTIKSILPAKIERIDVSYGGDDYKVNDTVNLESQEGNTFAFVDKISGKKVVSLATSSIVANNVRFKVTNSTGDVTAISNYPHHFTNNDVVNISGLSSNTFRNLFGSHKIKVISSSYSLTSGIGSTSITGIVTFIGLNGNLDTLSTDDILGIGTEQLLVLNVDKGNSRIRVERNYNSIPGFASTHSALETVNKLPREFSFNINVSEDYKTNLNTKYYFSPSSSVGIGTTPAILSVTLPGLAVTSLKVPAGTIYLPNHNFKTGQILRYSYGSGQSIGVSTSTSGIGTFTLGNNSLVYAVKFSNDFLGISTNPIGIGSTSFVGLGVTYTGSLYFINTGFGEKHSFETIQNELSGKATKQLTTILTENNHDLVSGDEIELTVSPSSISTSIVVEYNDFNKVVTINPVFASGSGINTSTSLITTSNSFNTGDKVVYESSQPATPLQNNGTYFVKKYDDNSFYVYTNKYNLDNDIFVSIANTGGSSHKFSLINPSIEIKEGHVVRFNLSSSTLSEIKNNSSAGIDTISSFEFKLFEDKNYQFEYIKSKEDIGFNVIKTGNIGITSNAEVALTVTENTPRNLYYKLVPTYESIKKVFDDNEILSNNTLVADKNDYNKKYSVFSGIGTQIYLNENLNPNTYPYSTSNSSISYVTNSKTASGSINDIKISYSSNSYRNLPGISSITSVNGKNAILDLGKNKIGKVLKIESESIGYGNASDFSLRPSALIPGIYKINQLSTINNIGITSAGKNYTLPPKLIVVDRVTKQENTDFILDCKIQGSGISEVTVINKDYTLYDTSPIILPKNGTNGIGVTSVTYNSSTNEVTATLNVVFSDPGTFPFSVGQKVLVENIGIASTGTGYNTFDYDYDLFTISSVNENLGALGSITYKLPYGTTNPGTYSPSKSFGSIIPENLLPTFNVSTSKNDFFVDESILVNDQKVAKVDYWDSKNKILNLITYNNISVGDILRGNSSGGRGVLIEKNTFNANYSENSYKESNTATWNNNIGFLNDPSQVIPDNNYYQNFSYAIKSDISYENWNESVSSLVHASGFKKFSNLQVENYKNLSQNNNIVQNTSDVIVDFVSELSLNCIDNFDFATERTINNEISKEVNFKNRILSNYIKSISNRSLKIDDISYQFNSNPRSTPYSVIDEFDLDNTFNKYIVYIEDSINYGEREIVITSFIHDQGFSWMNTYGRTESVFDLGGFDFSVSGTKGQLLFYPTKYEYNDYTARYYAYRVKSNPTNLGELSLGNFVSVGSTFTSIASSPTPSSSNIFSFSTSSYSASKILLQAETTDSSNKYQTNEISIVQNGSNIELLNYGQINSNNNNFVSGVGTFNVLISGSDAILQFTPNAGIAVTFNVLYTNFASSGTGIGSTNIKTSEIISNYTAITSSPSPTATNIASYELNHHDAAYYLINILDKTNNNSEFIEALTLYNQYDVFISQYGNVSTLDSLGSVGITSSSGYAYLTFTPNPNIDVEVRVLQNSLVDNLTGPSKLTFNNSDASIESGRGLYQGTKTNIKRAFDLTHQTYPIFSRNVYSSGIDTATNKIMIENHYFVSGEEIEYTPEESLTINSIGIASTSFAGIGVTSLLPITVYVIKENENEIRLARTSQEALLLPPIYLDLTDVGIGTVHKFTAKKQDTKCLISIDNNIQSPLVSTSTTSTLSSNLNSYSSVVELTSSQNFVGADLIRIGDEYMKINSIGYAGDLNKIIVERAWMGSENTVHSLGDLVRKYDGNYTIIDNTLNFIEAPYGKNPNENPDDPDERDWTGIKTSSSFNGRAFIRNAGVGATIAYDNNYVFNDISAGFDGLRKNFTLQSDSQNITGVATNTGIILVNEIFQTPNSNYTLTQNVGITSINFIGLGVSASYDVNTASLPKGGIIVSVGSSQGFGYQPLVSAGGTAIVSVAGTIQSISIGNSGSGYRSGIQTTVNVAVSKTDSSGISSYVNIGIASISNGNIVSVAITNPGFGFTSSNPPLVIFDDPLSYSNIPLQYANGISGLGTEAKINVVVGQGSSVVDFEIQNYGYRYSPGEILTIPTGGTTGIPTTGSGFSQFYISIEKVFNDKFAGWTFGQLEVLDDISARFDGVEKIFDLTKDGAPVSFITEKGSLIDIQSNLIVFINNILQVPGESYIFDGGSVIEFTEAPKGLVDGVENSGDSVSILFYSGSSSDSEEVDVLETIKVGDSITLNQLPQRDIGSEWQQNPRIVTKILNVDKVETNSYTNPGVSTNTSFARPVTWCKQTSDLIINGKKVTKDRPEYESNVYPVTRIIQPVSVGSTQIYVENVLPLFYSNNENLTQRTTLSIIDTNSRVAASATAIVSIAGTVSSIVISDGGVGYTTAPTVTISNPVGLGTTQRASSFATISSGSVISATIVNPGFGYTYTNPPSVLIDSNPLIKETLPKQDFSYVGDFGIIVGVGSTSIVGVATTGINFDLFLPVDSVFRDNLIVGTAKTVSGISTGDYILINSTNLGFGVTSIRNNGSVIGIGTTFLDNVYQIATISRVTSTVPGVGSTTVLRITTNVLDNSSVVGFASTSNYGNFSWGRIDFSNRSSSPQAFNVGLNSGLVGLTTSPVMIRDIKLKYYGYKLTP